MIGEDENVDTVIEKALSFKAQIVKLTGKVQALNVEKQTEQERAANIQSLLSSKEQSVSVRRCDLIRQPLLYFIYCPSPLRESYFVPKE